MARVQTWQILIRVEVTFVSFFRGPSCF